MYTKETFKNRTLHDRIVELTKQHKYQQYIEFLKEYASKLSWKHICINEAFTTSHALEFIDTVKPFERVLVTNKSIDWHQINPSIDNKSKSPNVTIDDILASPNDWDFLQVSKSELITMQDVMQHLDLPWCYMTMSSNPNVTESFVKDHLDKHWNYIHLSGQHNISLDFIKQHALRYDNWLVSSNANLTIDAITRHIHAGHKFDPDGLSLNPNLTWEVIDEINKLTTVKWNMYVLAKHIPLTEELVDAQFDTLREGLLHNPTLTATSIRKHIAKFKQMYKHKYWLSKHPSQYLCLYICLNFAICTNINTGCPSIPA